MKISTTLPVFFTLAGFCVAAQAVVPVNVAVYATEKSYGSMSVGGKNSYTKTFDIVVANLSGKDIDLSKLCLKAYSPDHKEFTVDTVDEVLTEGTLKDGKSVKSFAVFASENDAIFKAALIKISDNCK
ncbi:DUF4354 family protein [Cedecea sp. MMO-103]|uniref:DUF4354 family protein n=1 Tax=Cedecea sp. MMO-103 TaxID=3081238 RepID=UPI0030169DBD